MANGRSSSGTSHIAVLASAVAPKLNGLHNVMLSVCFSRLWFVVWGLGLMKPVATFGCGVCGGRGNARASESP